MARADPVRGPERVGDSLRDFRRADAVHRARLEHIGEGGPIDPVEYDGGHAARVLEVVHRAE